MKSTYLLMILAGLLTFCSSPASQEESTPPETFLITEAHAPVWQNAIAQVKALVDSMPADQLGYRPHDSVRTFAEQIVHIAISSKVITNLYLKDVPPSSDQPEMDIPSMSKEDLKQLVDTRLNETWELMASMSDQALQETIKSFGGNEMTRLEGMLTVHDHLTNHKAKANLYIRISGNTPPRYGYY